MTNVRNVEVIQVIRVTAITGKGTPHDPVRGVVEYWSLDGERLAVVDPNFGEPS